jgi:hypothetical protein
MGPRRPRRRRTPRARRARPAGRHVADRHGAGVSSDARGDWMAEQRAGQLASRRKGSSGLAGWPTCVLGRLSASQRSPLCGDGTESLGRSGGSAACFTMEGVLRPGFHTNALGRRTTLLSRARTALGFAIVPPIASGHWGGRGWVGARCHGGEAIKARHQKRRQRRHVGQLLKIKIPKNEPKTAAKQPSSQPSSQAKQPSSQAAKQPSSQVANGTKIETL